MRFDYIDIGTSDFDTSASIASARQNVLLVEPISIYLNTLPTGNNIFKSNVAIGDTNSSIDIFYVHPDKIKEYRLPDWVRGSNSIGDYHPIVKKLLLDSNLPLDIVTKETIRLVTLNDLFLEHNVESVGQLKIDAEGYDHYILAQAYEKTQGGLIIDRIIFEYNIEFKNTDELDKLVTKFKELGYNSRWASKKKRDIILEK
jgi:FkbM family methyltransferase